MSVYFLDTSTLAKRYIQETGSAWVRALCAVEAANILVISRITFVEAASAFARRQREGTLTKAEVEDTIDDLRVDIDVQYQVIELSEALGDKAARLVQRHALRAYDAVQLASALEISLGPFTTSLPPITFLSADNRLLAFAQAEGLLVDNPNNH